MESPLKGETDKNRASAPEWEQERWSRHQRRRHAHTSPLFVQSLAEHSVWIFFCSFSFFHSYSLILNSHFEVD